ncbi:MAG TPA: dipeptide epimerase [Steroidobacteraceae bacterium]|jgi:L-alanine-DL-glutamate epimerase-like enolase superfamily enzyme|nr:dipeptide epimerase [Steroidobacteraceae bacterium]
MSGLKLAVSIEKLEFSAPFRIAGRVFEHQDAVVVSVDDGTQCGRGEASGVFFLGERVEQMAAQIEAQRGTIERGIDRDSAQHLLPPGGARNALDCALWELEARRAGRPVWALAGLTQPKPLLTTFTLGADTPELMAAGARRFGAARALKVKLTGELALDAARVARVRAARPDVWLGVDANQGYSLELLPKLTRFLVDARVELLEQPVARGHEAGLEDYVSPIPIAADESALVLGDIAGLVGRFDVVNIKLDKCGGLTEGLAMAHEARRLGLKVMVGNMMGTSLAMAPAFVLGQLCDVVDLDGPTFLRQDRVPGVRYSDGLIECDAAVWGSPRAA